MASALDLAGVDVDLAFGQAEVLVAATVIEHVHVAFNAHDDEHEPAVVINPKLKVFGDEIELREGCLSVPGMVGEIVRGTKAAVTGLDRHGNKIRIEGEGLLAQCLQHEVDHLDGKLYIDRAANVRPVLEDEEKEAAEA